MYKGFLFLFLSIIIFNSCRTDFDVNDKWKEINVVYALLETRDSVNTTKSSYGTDSFSFPTQYFRISKAFLNTGKSANDIAKDPDSLFNINWIVTLQEIRGGNVVNTTTLQTTNAIPRDSGLFSSYQVLYKAPDGFTLNPTSTYKIIVTNTKTGVTSSATTNIVGIARPRTFPNQLSFQRGITTNFSWTEGINARCYDMIFRFHYTEWPKADPTKISHKVIEWTAFSAELTSALDGSQTKTENIDGASFYNIMAQTIPIDNSVQRSMSNDNTPTGQNNGVEIIIQGGGDDIYNYIQAARPSIGIVQKKTLYTNVTNGYGIFSSRAVAKYFLPLNKPTKDTLVFSYPTSLLGFVK